MYDIQDRLEEISYFFDCYTRTEFTPEGDVWASLDIVIGVTKLLPLNLDDLVCLPSESSQSSGPKKAKLPLIPKISIKTSLLVQKDIDAANDGELVILGAVEEIVFDFKGFLQVSFGAALTMLRIRSENPECAPSGLFFSADVTPKIIAGDLVQPFLEILTPTDTKLRKSAIVSWFKCKAKFYSCIFSTCYLPIFTEVDFGVTWQDRGAPDADDILQSLFFRLKLEDYHRMSFFSLVIDEATIEVQYFDEKEFERRRNFEDTCGDFYSGNYEIPNSPLADFINNDEINPWPTIGLFLDVQGVYLDRGFDFANGRKCQLSCVVF